MARAVLKFLTCVCFCLWYERLKGEKQACGQFQLHVGFHIKIEGFVGRGLFILASSTCSFLEFWVVCLGFFVVFWFFVCVSVFVLLIFWILVGFLFVCCRGFCLFVCLI